MLKNKNQSIAKIINKKNNQEYEVATVISVGNKTVDVRLLSGGVYRHVPLSGSAAVGDQVQILFIKGKPTAMAGGGGAGGTTQVVITQGDVTSNITPGDYAPTPHDVFSAHHVWPSVAANQFLVTTTTPGNPGFRNILLSDIQTVADTRYALNSRTITAGNGLTGTATLNTNITLNVVGGDGISVAADSVNVALAASSGLEFETSLLRISDSIAGSGIGINASKVLSVSSSNTFSNTSPALSGIQTESDGIRLYASNNPGANEHVLATSSAGQLTIPTLQATTSVITPLVTSASGNALTIESGSSAGIYLNPANNIVYLNSGKSFQSDGYASQTTGMRITHSGEADFRYVFADEIHAKSFIADLEQALAGGQIISKSVAVLAESFTLPAAGDAGTITVEDLPSAEGMAVFENNDWIGLRQFSRSSGSLQISWAWGRVTSYADLADKKQSWTFTRDATNPGTATGTIPADSLILDFGVSGNGFYEVNAIDGAYGQNSPYAQTVTWQTYPGNQTVRSRLGNLRGIFSQNDEFGIYGGTGTLSSSRYFRASSYEVELRNVPLRLYAGQNLTTEISGGTSNNSPYFAMGSTLPTGPLTNSGIWMGLDSTLYKFRVGTVSGGALTSGILWDGAQLNVVGSMKLSGNIYASPSTAGLYADGSRIGYWDGSAYRALLDSSGNFSLASSTLNALTWNRSTSTLTIQGGIRMSGSTYSAPSGSGLYGDGSRIGFYNANANQGGWRSWFDSSGNLTLRAAPVASGTGATGVIFTSSDGVLKGGYYTGAAGPSYGAFVPQWETDAQTGAILAGGGLVSLSASGIKISTDNQTSPTDASKIIYYTPSNTNTAQIYSSPSGSLIISANKPVSGGDIPLIGIQAIHYSSSSSLYVYPDATYIDRGLNVGTATGATTGQIKAQINSTETSASLEIQKTQILRYKYGPSSYNDANSQPFLEYYVSSNVGGYPYGSFLITFAGRDDGNAITQETWHFQVARSYRGSHAYSVQRISGTERVRARVLQNTSGTSPNYTGVFQIRWWVGGSSANFNDGLEITVQELTSGLNAGHFGDFSVGSGTFSGGSEPDFTLYGSSTAANVTATNRLVAAGDPSSGVSNALVLTNQTQTIGTGNSIVKDRDSTSRTNTGWLKMIHNNTTIWVPFWT